MVSFYEKIPCMYRALVEKVMYRVLGKKKTRKKFKHWFKLYESKPILTRFSRFSAFIGFLLFEKCKPHKLNILSKEAEEIGQARISRNEIIFP